MSEVWGWNLLFYDHTSDDYRGGSDSFYLFRSRDRADLKCAELNADHLARINAERLRQFNVSMLGWERRAVEHDVLAAAGLREPRLDTRPEFVPDTEPKSYYFVEPLEFEDD